MMLAEAFELDRVERHVEILATDIDQHALTIGCAATYDRDAVARLPHGAVSKYFDERDGRFSVKEPLRRVVRFELHDVLCGAPRRGMHLVICRGLAGALSAVGRRRVSRQLVRALEAGGLLVLGRGEWPEIATELETVDAVRGIYRRIPSGADA